MNRTSIAIALAGLALLCQTAAFAQPKLRADNIDEVIAAMTLDEKLNMLTGQGVGWDNFDCKFPGIAGWTYDCPRLGIPTIYFADGPQGINYEGTREFDTTDYNCTHYLSGSSLAATWDVNAAYTIGTDIGYEVKERGMDVILGPAINLHRTSLGGRSQEYHSEDPLLNGKISGAWIRGVQSNGVGTSLKHFAANNQETNRNRMDVRASVRTLRELYLKGFEIAVKEAQPWTVMSSYNLINGLYTSHNPELLTDILRKEWGFKGAIISDWGAVNDQIAAVNAGMDQIESGSERDRQALKQGLADGTVSMATIDAGVRRMLELVIKTPNFAGYPYQNQIRIDEHRARLRQVAAESIVLLKNDGDALPMENVKKVALYGVTSYDFIPANMGVGGTNLGHYHVSLVQGLREAGYEVYNPLLRQYRGHLRREKDRLEREYAGNNNVYYLEKRPVELVPTNNSADEQRNLEGEAAMANFGWGPYSNVVVSIDDAVRDNDIAIITLGRTTGEHADRKPVEFSLTDKEKDLIQVVGGAFHKAGKKVVVLLNIPTSIETASWRDRVDAIVMVGQPGERAGESIADVLSGKVNPCGRLADTWAFAHGDAPADRNWPNDFVEDRDHQPRPGTPPTFVTRNVDFTYYEEGIYVGYRYFVSAGKEVAYPFGYGLSYTTFEYSDAAVVPTGDGFRLTLKVTNTGKMAGKEVVELYVAAPKGKIEKPAKELKAFAKTSCLAPGQSETVTMEVSDYDLASYYEKSCAWIADKGVYTLCISKNANDVDSTLQYKLAKAKSWPTLDVLKPAEPINDLTLLKNK